MDISPAMGFIASHFTIKECEGKSNLDYLPTLKGQSRGVRFKTEVPKKTENTQEALAKKLFLDFHKELTDMFQK